MARTRPTVEEIVAHIKSLGGREITEEDKKAAWYKSEFAWPSCFKGKTPRKPTKKSIGQERPGLKTTPKKTAV